MMGKSIQDILGGMKEEKKEDVHQPKGNSYNGGGRSEWVSAFIKALRIGDHDTAARSYMVLTEALGSNNWYIIKTLYNCLGEDCTPSAYAELSPMLDALDNRREKNQNTFHDYMHAIYLVAKADKWYQTDEGVELEHMRHDVLWEDGEKNDVSDHGWGDKQLPAYALDKHSKKARILMSRGVETDERLWGGWLNRYPTLERWTEFVKENPEASMEELKEKWIEKFNEVPEGAYDPATTGKAAAKDWEPEIKKLDEHKYEIPSQSTEGKKYKVNLEDETCTCPYYMKRGKECKHLRKVKKFAQE
jgi:hypothetical protein